MLGHCEIGGMSENEDFGEIGVCSVAMLSVERLLGAKARQILSGQHFLPLEPQPVTSWLDTGEHVDRVLDSFARHQRTEDAGEMSVGEDGEPCPKGARPQLKRASVPHLSLIHI